MGTWDASSFGNDTALDFAAQLKEFEDIINMFALVEQQAGTIDADDAMAAIAACDIIAAIIGRPSPDLPDIPEFERDLATKEILKRAKSVVRRVRKKSELAELWKDEDEDEEWKEELDDLLTRLSLSVPYNAELRQKLKERPEDYLGACYICYGDVTARDGMIVDQQLNEGGTISSTPHRACLEKALEEKSIPGPYWDKDGAPTDVMCIQLLTDIGYEQTNMPPLDTLKIRKG